MLASIIEKPKGEARKRENKFDSVEYRKAFINYVVRGEKMPAEYRNDANTTTSDIGALIPPVMLNKIVEKIETYGELIPLVIRTAYKTGMTIPVASVKPVASWVAEGAGSDKQKLPLDASMKTFIEFVAMTDSNGQPIARVDHGIGSVPERTLLGRKVVLTNDLPSWFLSKRRTYSPSCSTSAITR